MLGHSHCAAGQVRGLMVQKIVVVPQLQFIVGRRHLLHDAAEAHLHGPDCSADHRDSPVAVRCQVVDVPVVDVYLQKTVEIPQLQLINKGFYIPVVAHWPSPMVQTVLRTIQIPQSLVDKVVAAPVMQFAGLSGRADR